MEYSTRVNSPTYDNLVSFQLSYTTADLERNVFHGAEAPSWPQDLHARGTLLVVHGDFYRLDEQATAPGVVPLTDKAGVFGIVDLAEHEP